MYEYAADSSMFSYYVISSEKWTKSIISNAEAKNPAIVQEVVEIVQTYRAYGLITLLNSDILISQAILETGWFTSTLWRQKRNPAGLGITGPGVPGIDYKSIKAGIQSHIAHVCCYFFDEVTCPACNLSWPDVRHRFHDNLETVADFTSGTHKWATDARYVSKMVDIVNSIAKEPY